MILIRKIHLIMFGSFKCGSMKWGIEFKGSIDYFGEMEGDDR